MGCSCSRNAPDSVAAPPPPDTVSARAAARRRRRAERAGGAASDGGGLNDDNLSGFGAVPETVHQERIAQHRLLRQTMAEVLLQRQLFVNGGEAAERAAGAVLAGGPDDPNADPDFLLAQQMFREEIETFVTRQRNREAAAAAAAGAARRRRRFSGHPNGGGWGNSSSSAGGGFGSEGNSAADFLPPEEILGLTPTQLETVGRVFQLSRDQLKALVVVCVSVAQSPLPPPAAGSPNFPPAINATAAGGSSAGIGRVSAAVTSGRSLTASAILAASMELGGATMHKLSNGALRSGAGDRGHEGHANTASFSHPTSPVNNGGVGRNPNAVASVTRAKEMRETTVTESEAEGDAERHDTGVFSRSAAARPGTNDDGDDEGDGVNGLSSSLSASEASSALQQAANNSKGNHHNRNRRILVGVTPGGNLSSAANGSTNGSIAKKSPPSMPLHGASTRSRAESKDLTAGGPGIVAPSSQASIVPVSNGAGSGVGPGGVGPNLETASSMLRLARQHARSLSLESGSMAAVMTPTGLRGLSSPTTTGNVWTAGSAMNTAAAPSSAAEGKAAPAVPPSGGVQPALAALASASALDDATLQEIGDATGDGSNALECQLCLEEFAEGDWMRCLPCGHFFHRDCADNWLSRKRLCPYCQHDATEPIAVVHALGRLLMSLLDDVDKKAGAKSSAVLGITPGGPEDDEAASNAGPETGAAAGVRTASVGGAVQAPSPTDAHNTTGRLNDTVGGGPASLAATQAPRIGVDAARTGAHGAEHGGLSSPLDAPQRGTASHHQTAPTAVAGTAPMSTFFFDVDPSMTAESERGGSWRTVERGAICTNDTDSGSAAGAVRDAAMVSGVPFQVSSSVVVTPTGAGGGAAGGALPAAAAAAATPANPSASVVTFAVSSGLGSPQSVGTVALATAMPSTKATPIENGCIGVVDTSTI